MLKTGVSADLSQGEGQEMQVQVAFVLPEVVKERQSTTTILGSVW